MVRFAVMASSVSAKSCAAAGQTGWQAALAAAVRDPVELCRILRLDRSLAVAAEQAAAGFPLLVPRPLLARIRPGDPHDPLLVQVLPCRREQARAPGFHTDPLGEADAVWGPGLLRKYPGRSLIVTTGACAVHCRFCFRRHFPYSKRDDPILFAQKSGESLNSCPVAAKWKPLLERIAAEESIREVILSGGDPLMLPDSQLGRLAQKLSQIPHVSRIRLHTRMPIVIPQRVTDELLGWLCGTRLSPIVVVHVNHPAEIDAAVAAALGRLVEAGIPVLSQTVLLRGVNDRLDVLAGLYQRLADLRVMPYYLHQLDRVAGAAHFEVAESTGVELIRRLRARLPGYAVPRYVRQTPTGSSKEFLA